MLIFRDANPKESERAMSGQARLRTVPLYRNVSLDFAQGSVHPAKGRLRNLVVAPGLGSDEAK